MKLPIFCQFGLKTPIHAPRNCFFWRISSQKWGAISTKHPKGRNILTRVPTENSLLSPVFLLTFLKITVRPRVLAL